MAILDRIPMQTVVVLALFLGLAPFVPEPHLWQKLKMLASGQLSRMIDIGDLLFHTAPSRFCRKVFSGLNRAAFRKFMQPSWQTV